MKVNLKKIEGNWTEGYALDKHMLHSTFIGHNESGHPQFDNKRTEAGEAVYQLKYCHDWNQVQPLADAIAEHIVPRFGPIGLVVPVPATRARARQPVYEVAKAVATKINVNSFDRIVVKAPATGHNAALKDLSTKQEKVAALAGRFTISDQIDGNGCWNVLVVDDLFHTGASLETVCAALHTYSKIDKIFVATMTWR